MTYITMNKNETTCILCEVLSFTDGDENLIVHRGQLAYVLMNRYPYTSGHLMVVPIKHASTLEELIPQARAEVMELTSQALSVLNEVYHPQGFNIGMNLGEAAGAGIAEHLHMHIVPRWIGDTNFMLTTASTRVLPEALEDTYQRIKEGWQRYTCSGAAEAGI
jgi:ATP adenylyltransferase